MTDAARRAPHDDFASVLLLVVVFAAWFGLCYGGAAALAPHLPWRVDVQLPLDARLPFWPAAAVLYLTITPMMLAAPFVLRDLASLLPLFAAFMLETTLGAVCFLLLPIDDAPVSCDAATLACDVFRIADGMNLHHNNLPSLHVAFAGTLALALALASRASRPGAALLFSWAILVAASTLVTRQHYVFDVVAGWVLAVACWRVASRWARRPTVFTAFDAELLVLRNMGRFAARHRRYIVIGVAILAAGIPRWRHRRLARVGFAFLQALDDILDGDRPWPGEPLLLADEMLVSLESGVFANHDLARLGVVFRVELLARGGPGALDDALGIVRAMRNDRRRVLEHEVSTREELRDIHRHTFRYSVDLMMRAAESPLRAADMPLFIDALGWCSTVRDLREDLVQGLINLPADVFVAATAEKPSGALPSLVATCAVREWLDQERVRARALLDRVDEELHALRPRRGGKILVRFARSMRKFA